jgi:hypothetical protein
MAPPPFATILSFQKGETRLFFFHPPSEYRLGATATLDTLSARVDGDTFFFAAH